MNVSSTEIAIDIFVCDESVFIGNIVHCFTVKSVVAVLLPKYCNFPQNSIVKGPQETCRNKSTYFNKTCNL